MKKKTIITEIPLSEFARIGLIGHRVTRVPDPDDPRLYRRQAVAVDLGEAVSEELGFIAAHGMTHKTVAVFRAEVPDGTADYASRLSMAFPFDKYLWHEPSDFLIWDGVRHVYSRKNRWYVDSDLEGGGSLRKEGISRIYLVYDDREAAE